MSLRPRHSWLPLLTDMNSVPNMRTAANMQQQAAVMQQQQQQHMRLAQSQGFGTGSYPGTSVAMNTPQMLAMQGNPNPHGFQMTPEMQQMPPQIREQMMNQQRMGNALTHQQQQQRLQQQQQQQQQQAQLSQQQRLQLGGPGQPAGPPGQPRMETHQQAAHRVAAQQRAAIAKQAQNQGQGAFPRHSQQVSGTGAHGQFSMLPPNQLPPQMAGLPQQQVGNQQAQLTPAQMEIRRQQLQAHQARQREIQAANAAAGGMQQPAAGVAAAAAAAAQQSNVMSQYMRLSQSQIASMAQQSMIRFHKLRELLSEFDASKNSNTMHHWENFVTQFFAEDGSYRLSAFEQEKRDHKQYEFSFSILPRYFYTLFNSGVQNVQIQADDGRESELENGGVLISCQRSSLIYWFENGSQVVWTGTIRARYNPAGYLESFEFYTLDHQEYLSRTALQASLNKSPPIPSEPKKSPKTAKQQNKQRANQQANSTPQFTLPESNVNSFGVASSMMMFFELAETMSIMKPLMDFSKDNPNLHPRQALESYVASHSPRSDGQPLNQQIPRNAGTPSLGMSYSGTHSPQIPTGGSGTNNPGFSQLDGMAGLQSNGSVSEHTTTAPVAMMNGTASLAGKKRRASAIKNEDDGQMQGAMGGTPLPSGQAQMNGGPQPGTGTIGPGSVMLQQQSSQSGGGGGPGGGPGSKMKNLNRQPSGPGPGPNSGPGPPGAPSQAQGGPNSGPGGGVQVNGPGGGGGTGAKRLKQG